MIMARRTCRNQEAMDKITNRAPALLATVFVTQPCLLYRRLPVGVVGGDARRRECKAYLLRGRASQV